MGEDDLTRQLAERLKQLRHDKNWSLDALAAESGVSRATLSRMENGDVSPTAAVLGKLCAAFGLPLSRLMRMVEPDFQPLIRRAAQPVWRDATAGFDRRSVSPPAAPLRAEVLECTLAPGACIAYDRPPRPGLEHHLILREGRLDITVDGVAYSLNPGDCLRYCLMGASEFRTAGSPARYALVIV